MPIKWSLRRSDCVIRSDVLIYYMKMEVIFFTTPKSTQFQRMTYIKV